jgi:hypothetical protein
MNRLIEHLVARTSRGLEVPDEVKMHIAGCRACIEELNAISTALTGQPSTLKDTASQFLTCEECQHALPAYIEGRIAGENVAALYSGVEQHLQGCAACRERYETLYEVMQAEAAGAFDEPPHYMTFEEEFRLQSPEQAAAAESAAEAIGAMWQQLAGDVHQLMADIPILIGKTIASFGSLPIPLAPRLVPVGVYRKKETPTAEKEEEFVELLELPHPEANLVIKLSMSSVSDGKGTLVLQVGTIASPRLIPQAKATLRDADDVLLESTPTDKDGLAVFRDLDTGKYNVLVEHAGQTWKFSVNLRPWPGA